MFKLDYFRKRPHPPDRYTKRFSDILKQLANKVAFLEDEHAIRPDHIFLATLIEGAGVGCAMLRAADVDLAGLIKPLAARRKLDLSSTTRFGLSLDASSIALLQRCREEALSAGDDCVGTQHFCVSIAERSDTIAGAMLRERNVSPELLRQILILFQASALADHDRWSEAIAKYEKAVHMLPTDWRAPNDFAWCLATCPDPRFRDGERALAMAQDACLMTNHANSRCLNTLAAAQAEVGHFDKAVELIERSMNLSPALDSEVRSQMLSHYRRGLPWRRNSAEHT